LFFKEVFRRSLTTSVSLFVLAACASAPEPIQTVERFNSREDDAGLTQFAYGISWQNSQLDPSFTSEAKTPARRPDQRQTNELARRDNDRRFAHQADKETKLELEDKAALGLSNKLKNQGLCAKGHAIQQVIWENGRIRLMGNCL
jgi:opacity protein-like surface antigen